MTKNIVFCADGSWSHPGRKQDGSYRYPGHEIGVEGTTNVFKLYNALNTSENQIAFYDDGVGSKGNPFKKLWEGALGEGLFEKIKDGYSDIAQTYDKGDAIHLFGFSRGAYTVRCLAGMISDCGLPDREKVRPEQWRQAVEETFEAYRERDPDYKKELILKLGNDWGNRAGAVKIAEVGVWDTVGSMGIPGKLFDGVDRRRYGFLNTKLPANVEAAWHALALDEHRKSFQPTLFDEPCNKDQTIEQVWFAGCHGDVGGGTRDPALSDIPLGWMMQKAISRGLSFDPIKLMRYTNLPPKRVLDNINETWSPAWGNRINRTIPQDATIADSVTGRMRAMPDYRPENLFTDEQDREKGTLPDTMKLEKVITQSSALNRW